MAYRRFSTGTWQDPWFERLSAKGKLLFIHLWTNDACNQAGVYKISQRRVEFETGIKFEDAIKELSGKVEWYPEIEVVWVKNFFKWQCQNPRFAFSAVRCLASIPKKIVDLFIEFNKNLLFEYDIDTVSIPYGNNVENENGVCLSVTDTEQKQKQIQRHCDIGLINSGKSTQKESGSRRPSAHGSGRTEKDHRSKP